MGIADTVRRSRRDLDVPAKRSYADVALRFSLLSKEEVVNKKNHLPHEIRALTHELSGIEPVEEVVLVEGADRKLTLSMMKEMLNDMGFNVDTIISGAHEADFTAVMNINGYIVPGWRSVVGLITRFFPHREKMLLSKLAPGKDRLHIRIFGSDGEWIIISHTDPNWMKINLLTVFKGHVGYGAGDYVFGTHLMVKLLEGFLKQVKKNETFTQKDIDRIAGDLVNKRLLKGGFASA